ncbi:MAG: SRPBCC family protein [Longimicrobiales bacterium]
MGVRPEGMYEDTERYDHLGDVQIGAIDLDNRYRELTEQRRVFLAPEEAHVTVRHRFRAAPADLWQWLNDTERRSLWMRGTNDHVEDRPRGRTGVGAHNHCSNGDILEEVLDWRPFEYFTVRMTRGFVRVLMTWELQAVDKYTELRTTMALEGSAPRFARAAACRLLVGRVMQFEGSLRALDDLMANERVEAAVEAEAAV